MAGVRVILMSVRVILMSLGLASATVSIASTAAFAGDRALRLAPDFTRMDLSGNSLSLRPYRGKVVLLNFWATWCAPCLMEIPTFEAWQNTYGAAGLQIVGISMDDDSAPAKRAYEKYHLNYPVAMGDTQLAQSFGGVLGLPLSYLIDPDGRVVGRYQGELDLTRLEAKIKSMLPRLHP
jgi:cytochrome c biogenesis protein CcmG, thiol:disulfide interchange protein DsbE